MTIKSINIKVICIGLFLYGSMVSIRAQEYTGSPTPHSIKLDFKLPTGVLNKPFSSFLSGLIDTDLNYQYSFLDGKLSFGIGAKYAHWEIISTKLQTQNVVGSMNFFNPFILVAHKRTISEKIFLEVEAKFGYASVLTKSNKRSELYVQNAFSFEPKFGVYLKASDLTAVGITVNYAVIAAKFRPENLNIDYFPVYNEQDISKNYNYFSIGLGAYLTIPTFK